MLKQKELLILEMIRKNSRESLTSLSRKTKIPVTTIYGKLKEFEGKIIKKYTALLNFKKLGFDIRVNFLVRAKKEKEEDLLKLLKMSENTNNVFRTNNGYSFFVEAIFKDMQEYKAFYDKLYQYSEEVREFFVLDEIKEQDFLTNSFLAY